MDISMDHGNRQKSMGVLKICQTQQVAVSEEPRPRFSMIPRPILINALCVFIVYLRFFIIRFLHFIFYEHGPENAKQPCRKTVQKNGPKKWSGKWSGQWSKKMVRKMFSGF